MFRLATAPEAVWALVCVARVFQWRSLTEAVWGESSRGMGGSTRLKACADGLHSLNENQRESRRLRRIGTVDARTRVRV